ncbi:MAG: hypothetical protein AB1726_14960 [Planctomycetota bacterium]
MTRTARRRWSREFSGEIDGIALGDHGPVFLHGYDPPAGGKWIDDVIPGKLVAYDRHSGDELWRSPCEVGYGRGFGSGLGEEDDVVVLGPCVSGHRIARMSRSTGELIGAREIEPFDQALVFGDTSITVASHRVNGIATSPMIEVWTHAVDGERYHIAGRSGASVLVTYTDLNRRTQGVHRLDVASGDYAGPFLEADLPVIHDLSCDDHLAVLLLGSRPLRAGGPEALTVAAFGTEGGGEARPLWQRVVANDSIDELPDVSILVDSGKLYVTRGAILEVWDGLSARPLGELTLPGLDERVAWSVRQGAALLAEETRASIFELPA